MLVGLGVKAAMLTQLSRVASARLDDAATGQKICRHRGMHDACMVHYVDLLLRPLVSSAAAIRDSNGRSWR